MQSWGVTVDAIKEFVGNMANVLNLGRKYAASVLVGGPGFLSVACSLCATGRTWWNHSALSRLWTSARRVLPPLRAFGAHQSLPGSASNRK